MYRLGSRQTIYAEFYTYSSEVGIDRLSKLDSYAARDIEDCLKMIEDCKEYRKGLQEHVNNILAERPIKELRLVRSTNYGNNKKYYRISIHEIYKNGEYKTLDESFSGTDRHKAFKRFEELKKQHPGIKTIKNIEKGRWEK